VHVSEQRAVVLGALAGAELDESGTNGSSAAQQLVEHSVLAVLREHSKLVARQRAAPGLSLRPVEQLRKREQRPPRRFGRPRKRPSVDREIFDRSLQALRRHGLSLGACTA
jgi:hypothetical protein